jgi:hypothetical protein
MIQDKWGGSTLTSYLCKTMLLVVQKLPLGRLDPGGYEMLKNKSSPMIMKSTPLLISRHKIFGGANGSKNRVYMQKLLQYEVWVKQVKSQLVKGWRGTFWAVYRGQVAAPATDTWHFRS